MAFVTTNNNIIIIILICQDDEEVCESLYLCVWVMIVKYI